MPASGMRQAHTEGDKQQCLGQHAGLRISFSGFLPGTEMGSEDKDPSPGISDFLLNILSASVSHG